MAAPNMATTATAKLEPKAIQKPARCLIQKNAKAPRMVGIVPINAEIGRHIAQLSQSRQPFAHWSEGLSAPSDDWFVVACCMVASWQHFSSTKMVAPPRMV